MSIGDIHEIATNLFVIEGHHPHTLWEDPDIPSIALYRTADTLYLLDSGVGPAQRAAIGDIAGRFGPADEVVLLNSHGHVDHLGNNDVLAEIPAQRRRHLIPRCARAALDHAAFFRQLYQRGVPYFDYLEGLDLDPEAMTSLLRALGADTRLDAAEVGDIGKRIQACGIAPVIAQFVPSLLVDVLLSTYPPIFPSVATMADYEDLAEASAVEIGSTSWLGWTLGGGEVQVLLSEGHSAGGTVFYLPEHRFLMLADETSTVPIWSDSDPRNTVRTATRALSMMDSGHLDQLCAGHRPMLPIRSDEARAVLRGLQASATEFAETVDVALLGHPGGVTIDELYTEVVSAAHADSIIALLRRLQFPVFATFLKLTLLNHCLLLDLPQERDGAGRITFRAV